MSWHCNCKNSTDEKKPWVHVHVAFVDSGIPITFVCHADCLRKALCESNGVIIDEMDNINDTFLERLKDIENDKKYDIRR
jgi:hypothetical protein